MKGKVTGGRVIGVKDLKMGEGTSYAEKIEGNKRNFGRKVVSFLFFLIEVCNIALRCINIDIQKFCLGMHNCSFSRRHTLLIPFIIGTSRSAK